MRREYPERVRELFDEWDEEETRLFVNFKGVSDRNWHMLCLEAGVVDGRRWKQREIATEYKLTNAGVSKILRTVMNRLLDIEEGRARTKIGLMRTQRVMAYRILRWVPVVNASKMVVLASKIRDYSRLIISTGFGWDCKIVFVADKRRLHIASVSCLKDDKKVNGTSVLFVILWAKEATKDDFEHDGNLFKAENESIGRRCNRGALLVINYKDLFWVVDKFDFHKGEKCLVVHLAPAEYGPVKGKREM